MVPRCSSIPCTSCSSSRSSLLVAPRLPWRRQNLFLLAASYFFYGSWDWRFAGLLLLTTTLDFVCALRVAAATGPRRRRRWLLVSVIGNLAILGVFKYCGFFVASLGALLGRVGLEPHLPVLRIVLPVGISFYTFQSLSYTSTSTADGSSRRGASSTTRCSSPSSRSSWPGRSSARARC